MGISSALGSSALLPAGLGFRNLLINGAMTVDQRNAGAAVSTNSAYPVDRWVTSSSTSGAWTFQQLSPTSGTTSSPLPPAGFRSYIKFTKTTGATPAATGQPNYFLQHIEGFNSAQLSWGRSDAKPATLSFWVYSGATGTFGGSLRSTSVNYWSFPFSYTINSANTWEYKTIQVLPITSGTWYTDNQIGVSLFFDLGSSADYRGTNGAWANSNLIGVTGASQYPTTTSGGYMCWTGVQLEQNYQPTPFEQRPIGVELALCQRYYYRFQMLTSGGYHRIPSLMQTYSASAAAGIIFNPVPLRLLNGATSIEYFGVSLTDNATFDSGFGTLALNTSNSSPYTTYVSLTSIAGTVTQGSGRTLELSNASSYLGVSAEL